MAYASLILCRTRLTSIMYFFFFISSIFISATKPFNQPTNQQLKWCTFTGHVFSICRFGILLIVFTYQKPIHNDEIPAIQFNRRMNDDDDDVSYGTLYCHHYNRKTKRQRGNEKKIYLNCLSNARALWVGWWSKCGKSFSSSYCFHIVYHSLLFVWVQDVCSLYVRVRDEMFILFISHISWKRISTLDNYYNYRMGDEYSLIS